MGNKPREHTTHFDDCGCLSLAKNKQIAALEVRNAELREGYDRQFQDRIIPNLQKMIADLERRNAEQEKEINNLVDNRDEWINRCHEFEQKLKTAEDALAVLTKEKQDIQDQIKRNNDAQINKNLDDYYKPPTWKHS